MRLYQPNGRDIEEINIGEKDQPHLFDITGGERDGALTFHFKIVDIPLGFLKSEEKSVQRVVSISGFRTLVSGRRVHVTLSSSSANSDGVLRRQVADKHEEHIPRI